MSRFYNALREASRWQTSKESGWDGLKPPAEPASAEPATVAAAAAATAPVATEVESPAMELAEELQAFVPHEPQQAPSRGFFGRLADVTMDKKARLIPHAVDPGVVEHYRKLRTKIMQQHTAKPFRSLVVT